MGVYGLIARMESCLFRCKPIKLCWWKEPVILAGYLSRLNTLIIMAITVILVSRSRRMHWLGSTVN